jgi:hypothetical protein
MGSPRLNVSFLSAKQEEMADTIRRLFLDAGFSEWVAAAAVVNSFRESSLNPKEKSKSGRYRGLFMLSPDILKSEWAREQPDLNTQAIISEAFKAPEFMKVAESEDLFELVEAFSTYVERPKDKDIEAAIRIEKSLRLYPDNLVVPDKKAPLVATEPTKETDPMLWWIGALLLTGAGIVAYKVWGKKK